jgi:hypothetical protein
VVGNNHSQVCSGESLIPQAFAAKSPLRTALVEILIPRSVAGLDHSRTPRESPKELSNKHLRKEMLEQATRHT